MSLLALVAILTVIQLVFRAGELSLFKRLDRHGIITRAEGQASDDRLRAIATIIGLVLIVLVVLWCMWQHRSQANLKALGAANLKYTPGWAVGWWFIPFAFWVVPYRTMRELWMASDPDAGSIDWQVKRATSLLLLWWLAWLCFTTVFPSIALSIAPSKFDGVVHHYVLRDMWLLARDVTTIIAAFLAIVLVRQIDARQQAKFQKLSSWSQGMAPSP
jgi:hypothetical protein